MSQLSQLSSKPTSLGKWGDPPIILPITREYLNHRNETLKKALTKPDFRKKLKLTENEITEELMYNSEILNNAKTIEPPKFEGKPGLGTYVVTQNQYGKVKHLIIDTVQTKYGIAVDSELAQFLKTLKVGQNYGLSYEATINGKLTTERVSGTLLYVGPCDEFRKWYRSQNPR